MPHHTTTIIEITIRPAPRAPLQEVLYWHAELTNAQRWTLCAQIRTLLAEYPTGHFVRTEASQDVEDRATAKGL